MRQCHIHIIESTDTDQLTFAAAVLDLALLHEAFLKLHFPKINTTYRADMTTKQTTHAFLGITMRCAGFLAPFHRLVTAVVTGNITASTANTFIEIDMGIDNITAV